MSAMSKVTVILMVLLAGATANAGEGDGCLVGREAGVGAMAAQPETGALYAVREGHLVRRGEEGFEALGKAEGLRGLTFDPRTGALYAVRGGALVELDPATGAVRAGAFGQGVDEMALFGLAQGEAVVDIAIDALEGRLYAAVAGPEGGRLLTVGRASGATREVGTLDSPLSALSADSAGHLWASTANTGELVRVERDTARLLDRTPLETRQGVALSCLCAGLEGCAMDADGDGLSNAREVALGTDPMLADTDGDGDDDRVETEGGRFVDLDNDDVLDALQARKPRRVVRSAPLDPARHVTPLAPQQVAAATMGCDVVPGRAPVGGFGWALVALGATLILRRRS